MKRAFQLAEDRLGIPQLLEAELLVEHPDDLCIMTYVSYFRNTTKAEKQIDLEKTQLGGSALRGLGVTGLPTEVEVRLFSSDGTPFLKQDLQVETQLENSQGAKNHVPASPKSPGIYVAQWTPEESGEFTVRVTVDGTSLSTSPSFTITRAVKPLDPSKSSLKGANGKDTLSAAGGDIVEMVFTARDSDGNPVPALASQLGLRYGSTDLSTTATEERPGEYHLRTTLPQFSSDGHVPRVGLTIHGKPEPFELTVSLPSMDVTRSPAFLGIVGGEFVAATGKEIHLIVEIRDSRGIRMNPPKDLPLSVKIEQLSPSTGLLTPKAPEIREDGTVMVQFQAGEEGVYQIHLQMGEESLSGGPLKFRSVKGNFSFEWEKEKEENRRASEQEIEKLKKEFEEKSGKLFKEMENIEDERNKLFQSLKAKETALENVLKQLSEKESESQENQRKLKEKEEENEQLEQRLKDLQSSSSGSLQEKDQTVAELRAQLKEKEKEIESKDSTIEELRAKLQEKEKEAENIKSTIGEQTAKLNDKEKEIEELKSQASTKSHKLEETAKEVETIHSTVEELTTKLKAKEQEIDALKSKDTTIGDLENKLREKQLELEEKEKKTLETSTALSTEIKERQLNEKELNEKFQAVSNTLAQLEKTQETEKGKQIHTRQLTKHLSFILGSISDKYGKKLGKSEGTTKKAWAEGSQNNQESSQEDVDLDSINQELEECNGHVTELSKLLDTTDEELRSKETTLEEQIKTGETLERTCKELKEQLDLYGNEKNQSSSALESLRKSQQEWKTLQNELEETINKLKEEKEGESSKAAERIKELEEETSSFRGTREQFEELQRELKKAQEEAEKQRGVALKASLLVVTLMTQLGDLEAQMTALHAKNEEVTKRLEEISMKLPFYQRHGFDSDPPTGHVTLVFTDVQGSTTQWELHPQVMSRALQVHNYLMRMKIGEFHGYEVKTEGDAFMIAFHNSLDAIKWCLAVQESLLHAEWPPGTELHPDSALEYDSAGGLLYRGFRVRMGVHVGEPSCEEDPVTKRMDYFGQMVNRSARVEGVANGGQIVLSSDVWEEIKSHVAELGHPRVELLGDYQMKGLDTPTRVYEMVPKSLSARRFPKIGKPDEKEKKFKTLEEELDKLKNENESLGNQFAAMKELLDAAKSKMMEFVELLKETAGEDASLLAALGELNSLVEQQEKLKAQQSIVEKAAQEASEVASTPSDDQLNLLRLKLEQLRMENEKLKAQLNKNSVDLLLYCTPLASTLKSKLGELSTHEHKHATLDSCYSPEEAKDPNTKWSQESKQEIEEIERLRKEISQIKKEFLHVNHAEAPVILQSAAVEEKLSLLQEDLDKKLGNKKKPKKLKRKVVEGDAVDQMLVEVITELDIDPHQIKRVSEGVYMIGGKKIHMKILSGRLTVRVGGGYMAFREWLEKYGHKEGLVIAFRDAPQEKYTVSGTTLNRVRSPTKQVKKEK